MSSGERPPLLIVGWDGVELYRLRWLLKSGHMPHLRRLAKQGRDGNLVIAPPLTPATGWTTLLTGVPALEHRVLTEVEPDGRGDLRPVQSTSRRRPALWNYATGAGLRGAYVGFPATAPAEPIEGAMLTDKFCERAGRDESSWPTKPTDVSPADRFNEFRQLVVHPTDIQVAEVNALIGDARVVGDQAAWLHALVAETLAATSTVHNLASSLLEEGGYPLCAVRYRCALTMQRALLGVESRRLNPSEDTRQWANDSVHACYGLLDMMLGRLLELIGDEANVMVMSNLGFESEPRPIIEEQVGETSDSIPIYDPHRHFNSGGTLLASGPDITHGSLPHIVRDIDLLPTVMTLLGYDPPAELPGRVITLGDHAGTNSVNLSTIPDTDDNRLPTNPAFADPWLEDETSEDHEPKEVERDAENTDTAIFLAKTRRLQNLEQALTHAGKNIEALDVLHQLRKLQDSMYVRVRIVECYLALDDMKRAGAVIARLKQLAPDSIVPVALEAYARSLRGQHTRASNMLREVLERQPGSPHLWLQYGCSLLAEGEHFQAKQWLEWALRVGGHRWQPHWGLAQCHRAAGEHGLAQHHFGRCHDLGGPHPDSEPLPLPTMLKRLLRD